MRFTILTALLVVLLCPIVFANDAINQQETGSQQPEPISEHLVWKQTPLVINLPLDQEKELTFPGSVAFGYDKSILSDEVLGVQNNNGTLYLKAKKPFTTQRVQIKLVQTGKIILLDLSADEHGDATPAIVVIHADTTDQSLSPIKPQEENQVNEVNLMRYAVQQLYAPKRLLPFSTTIYRIPMRTTHQIHLFRDNSVIARPLASWREQNTTITAVQLQNALKQVIRVDPKSLCGAWQAAIFYPRTWLMPTGNLHSMTTVFLLTNQSFNEALEGC